VIESVTGTLAARAPHPQMGAMRMVVTGESDLVFAVLADVFTKAAQSGEVAMNVTVSDACPVPRIMAAPLGYRY
jgi:hypothetical protein